MFYQGGGSIIVRFNYGGSRVAQFDIDTAASLNSNITFNGAIIYDTLPSEISMFRSVIVFLNVTVAPVCPGNLTVTAYLDDSTSSGNVSFSGIPVTMPCGEVSVWFMMTGEAVGGVDVRFAFGGSRFGQVCRDGWGYWRDVVLCMFLDF